MHANNTVIVSTVVSVRNVTFSNLDFLYFELRPTVSVVHVLKSAT